MQKQLLNRFLQNSVESWHVGCGSTFGVSWQSGSHYTWARVDVHVTPGQKCVRVKWRPQTYHATLGMFHLANSNRRGLFGLTGGKSSVECPFSQLWTRYVTVMKV